MRKNITIGFSEPEFLRMQGAAAVARMPVSTYVKWLLQGSPVDGVSRSISLVLDRLDEINVSIATLSGRQGPAPAGPLCAHAAAPRELIEEKLRARGLPSSTIRQVSAVLEELERGR